MGGGQRDKDKEKEKEREKKNGEWRSGVVHQQNAPRLHQWHKTSRLENTFDVERTKERTN